MKQVLLLIMICITLNGYAQSEFSSNKFKAIAPLNRTPKVKKVITPEADLPPITTPNVFKSNLLNPKPSSVLTQPSNFSMIVKNEFINPGDVYRDKLNKKVDNEEQTVYRRNQNLGDFKTTSVTAKVLYRDAADVDGDEIRVYLNDRIVQYQVNLESEYKGFEIVLEKGFNKIDFEALNQGMSGPNTAQFQVFDDKGSLISSSQWNLGTGFKATIILVKE
jgi:hypothetical protein